MRRSRVRTALVLLVTVGLVLTMSPAEAVATTPTPSARTVLGTRVHVMPFGVHTTHHASSAGAVASFPAPLGTHLTYYGGRVVSNLQAVNVLYGSGSYQNFVAGTTSPNMGTFLGGSLNSGLMDWLGGEYNTVDPNGPKTNQNIGRGTYAGSHQITPASANNGSSIDDQRVQAELAAQIQAGALPPPAHDAAGNDNTEYILYFPAGKSICQSGGSCSMVAGGFCAYHGTIANVGTYGEVYYTVMPDFTNATGCGNAGTDFANETSVLSHEFVETVTDAEVGLTSAIGPPLAWYDPTNGEIGDICNAEQGSITGADGLSYTVQAEFSNALNACIVPATPSSEFSAAASPASVSAKAGSPGTTTISTAVAYGSAQSIALSASGLPVGATASFSPSTITAGGSSSLSIDAGTASAGTYPVTVTGTGTSSTHSLTVSVTVTSAATSDFSLSASPASVSVATGSSTTTTIGAAISTGSAQSISFAVTGAPSGVTTSLSPATVTAGNSSTLTLSASSSVVPGSYSLTVSGTATSGSHTTAVTLAVISSSTGISNGGYETGDLTGWTKAGPANSVVPVGHSGSYAAQVGSTSATNGDSSLAQTFTAPSGASSLSFYAQVVCPDTVTYDWATATLADVTASSTATVLAKTCSNTGAWQQVNAAVTAGHTYTLTLISHDDNYSGDPTHTLYDDVTLQGGPIRTAPAITSAASATFTAGAAGSFKVTTTGSPIAAVTSTGTLPAGVTLVDNSDGTATLAGMPASGASGTYPLMLTANNGIDPSAHQTFTLTIDQGPVVTLNPGDQTVNAGASVSFSAGASGLPFPAVQWQMSNDGGLTFSNINGATLTTLSFPTVGAQNGNQYRGMFTNTVGSATSTAATLTVDYAAKITSSLSGIATIGTPTQFIVTTTGNPRAALSASGLPAWITFTDNGDGTGTISANPPSGSAGATGIMITADNGIVGPDQEAFSFNVIKRTVMLVYSGVTSGPYSDPAVLTATLTDSVTGLPITGAGVTFTLGTQTATATTSTLIPAGIASTSLKVTQQPGTVAFLAAWAGNNTYGSVTATTPTTFTIVKESATVSTSSSNPRALTITTAGTAAAFTLSATVRETPDGSPGDITKITAVAFSLNGVAGGNAPGCIATGAGLTRNTSSGVLTAKCTVPAGTPINVYDVTVTTTSAYYTGTADDSLVVYDPKASGASGGGTLSGAALPPNTIASFSFLIQPSNNGGAKGKFLYVLTTYGTNGLPVSQAVLKGNSISTLAVSKTAFPYAAFVTGKATLNGVGNYAFSFTAQDTNGTSNDGDTFGKMSVMAPYGAPGVPAGMLINSLMTIATGDVHIH